MARALYVIQRFCKRERILSLQTDGIFIQPGAATRKIEDALRNLKYSDLPNLKDLFEGEPKAKQARLTYTGQCTKLVRESPTTSQDVVYKIQSMETAIMPGGTIHVDERPAPRLSKSEWHTVKEPEQGPDDFFDAVIKPRIMKGGAALVEGPPGFGKSYILKALHRELIQAGHDVAVIAPTHCAVRNLKLPGASTIHSFCHLHVLNGTFRGYVMIDEISQVSLQLAACLETLALSECKFICFGDRLQQQAIMPTWRGKRVPSDAVIRSDLLKLWSGCTRFEVSRYRRGIDPLFSAWFIDMRLNKTMNEALREAITKFPLTSRRANWNLCLSHHRRKMINQISQELAVKELDPRESVVRLVPDEATQSALNEAQAFDLFVGTKLIGCNSEHKGIVNSALLMVEKITDNSATLRDEETGETVELTHKAVLKHTRLRWAITLAACQGRTLEGVVRLHDIGSKYFTTTNLYVAASRCIDSKDFEVVPCY
jgi:tRNA uridine 5-carbamoylmethylation protein Kti12